MGYDNPLFKLPAAKKLLAFPDDQLRALEAVMRELRQQADELAERNWSRRKAPMAAYWRAVATYARHVAHVLSKGRVPRPVVPEEAHAPILAVLELFEPDANGQPKARGFSPKETRQRTEALRALLEPVAPAKPKKELRRAA